MSVERPGFLVQPGAGERVWFMGAQTTVLVTGADTAGRLAAIVHELPEGRALPAHAHEVAEELYVVLGGTVEIGAGGRQWRAEGGAVAVLPAGVVHTARAVGGPARVLVVTGPAGDETLPLLSGEPAIGDAWPDPPSPAALAALVERAAAYGIDVVPAEHPAR